jgi:uncharacterized membrane protein YfcA
MDYFLFVAIGLVAGVLAGVFGIGGGIAIVPAFILLARFTPQMATGISLAISCCPSDCSARQLITGKGTSRSLPRHDPGEQKLGPH